MKNYRFLLLISLISGVACTPTIQGSIPSILTTSPSFSPIPQNTPTPIDSSNLGSNNDENYVTVSGKIYDIEGNPIENAEVILRAIDFLSSNVSGWKADKQITVSNGAYISRSIPGEARLEITVTKDGYIKKIRETPRLDTLYSNTQFNFGGSNEADKIYALEKIK